ncbi:hypothetical protein TorRG33x02_333140 [Trema orientale]|uniref:Uncharacterized protein n=1 Tax=Trema orientale TaxID=63057 RepID=A0A2P5B4I7_TREOI|nr:hypothetical protein TorRG33x02_333140 [Trema orientale]
MSSAALCVDPGYLTGMCHAQLLARASSVLRACVCLVVHASTGTGTLSSAWASSVLQMGWHSVAHKHWHMHDQCRPRALARAPWHE